MTIEAGNFIANLQESLPTSNDFLHEGDDHIRLIKHVLLTTFPNADHPFALPGSGPSVTGDYTATSADNGKLIEIAPTVNAAFSLPDLPPEAEGYYVRVIKTNQSAAEVVVTSASGADISGFSEWVISAAYEEVSFFWTGTDWYASPSRASVRLLEASASATLEVEQLGSVVTVDSGAPVTLTLPPAADCRGRGYTIRSIGAGVTTVDGDDTELIDGSEEISVGPPQSIVSDGVGWFSLFGRNVFAAVVGTIASITLGADVNDWAPAGFASATVLSVDVTAAARVSGLDGGEEGRQISVRNRGAFPLTLSGNDTTSAAANRFQFNSGAPNTSVVIGPFGSVTLLYEASRWRAIGGSSEGFSQQLATSATVDWEAATATLTKWLLTRNSSRLNNATGLSAGRRGFLEITQDGTGGRSVVWGTSGVASKYVFLPAETPPAESPNAKTLFEWMSPDGDVVYLWRVGSTGGFTEYDLGALGALINARTTRAHGLGRVPTKCEMLLECSTAQFGYAVGERIFDNFNVILRIPDGEHAGASISSDNTNAVVSIAERVYVIRADTRTVSSVTPGNWKVFLRVYA